MWFIASLKATLKDHLLRSVSELTTFLSLILLKILFIHCVLEKSLERESRYPGLVPVSLELAVSCQANLSASYTSNGRWWSAP